MADFREHGDEPLSSIQKAFSYMLNRRTPELYKGNETQELLPFYENLINTKNNECVTGTSLLITVIYLK